MRVVAQFLDHHGNGFQRVLQHSHELGDRFGMTVQRADQEALGDLVHCFRDPRERTGERLDVLALQRRDEGLADLLSDLLTDALVFAPAIGQRSDCLLEGPFIVGFGQYFS